MSGLFRCVACCGAGRDGKDRRVRCSLIIIIIIIITHGSLAAHRLPGQLHLLLGAAPLFLAAGRVGAHLPLLINL